MEGGVSVGRHFGLGRRGQVGSAEGGRKAALACESVEGEGEGEEDGDEEDEGEERALSVLRPAGWPQFGVVDILLIKNSKR